jgi:hypothetical protein
MRELTSNMGYDDSLLFSRDISPRNSNVTLAPLPEFRCEVVHKQSPFERFGVLTQLDPKSLVAASLLLPRRGSRVVAMSVLRRT